MRTRPGIGPDTLKSRTPDQDSPGCIVMILVAVIGYFVLLAITRVTSGSGSRLDHIVCYATLIGLVILFAMVPILDNQEKKKLREERQHWKDTCKSAEAAILDRSSYPGGSYEDEYGIPHYSRASYHLDLEMNSDQRAVSPNLTRIRVDVYANIYEKLKDRNTVRIYYKPEAPMVFLLEEEI